MRLPLCAAILLASVSAASADGVSFRDLPNTDGRWQEASGVVDAPIGVVRTWMTDFRRWPQLYSDIEEVEVLEESGARAAVRFRSRIFDRRFTISVRRTPYGMVSHGQQGSITSEGKVWLSDLGDGRTRVTIQSYAHVGGFIGAFVSVGMLRDRLRQKLSADLVDLQRTARRYQALRSIQRL